MRNKSKKHLKLARENAAKWRARTTGARHYRLSIEEVGAVSTAIQERKSSFITRFAGLTLHKVMTTTGVVFAAYDKYIKAVSFFFPRSNGFRIARSVAQGRREAKRSERTQLELVSSGDDSAGVSRQRLVLKGQMGALQNKMDNLVKSGALTRDGGVERLQGYSDEYDKIKAELAELPDPTPTFVPKKRPPPRVDQFARAGLLNDIRRLQADLRQAERMGSRSTKKIAVTLHRKWNEYRDLHEENPPKAYSEDQRSRDIARIFQLKRALAWARTHGSPARADRLMRDLDAQRTHYRKLYGHNPDSVDLGNGETSAFNLVH